MGERVDSEGFRIEPQFLRALKPELLRQLLELSERREALTEEIKKLQNQLGDVEDKLVALCSTVSKPSGRNKLRPQILGLLEKAGPNGLTIQQIAFELETSANSVNNWFHIYGKKTPGVKHIGPSRFSYANPLAELSSATA